VQVAGLGLLFGYLGYSSGESSSGANSGVGGGNNISDRTSRCYDEMTQ
jgi:hypothetical protein